jgi:hypothetical protein
MAAVMELGSGAAANAAFHIQFDYRFDQQGFFTSPNRRAALEAAADVFEARIVDQFAAIVPQGGNTWEAVFSNPQSGMEVKVPNLTIPADTLLIFVGARDLDDTIVGAGGPGGWSATGFSQTWFDTVGARNEPNGRGVGATDFAPWGGLISFDTTAPGGSARNWHFDVNLSPPFTYTDFYTTALHELGHVLGIGSADSWNTYVPTSGQVFNGPASVALYGSSVPLAPGLAHWKEGTQSQLPLTGAAAETALDPSQTNGQRKHFTRLDFAALDDIGWDLAPEPSLLPTDFNMDGKVDLSDFTILKSNFGDGNVTRKEGDANLDGYVDLTDFGLLKSQFGQMAAASVPEPSAMALFAVGMAIVAASRLGA